jgi:hypothetical protein
VDAFSSSDPLPPGPLPYADITNPQSLNKYTYTYNNPLKYLDPDGHDPLDFLLGVANAVTSNLMGGVGRKESYNQDHKIGQAVGDVISVAGGAVEVLFGAATASGGAVACGTGAACVVGAPAVVGGVAIATHGGTVMASATGNLLAEGVPNPFGSRGAPDHQKTADQEAARMGQGGQTEVRVETPGGARGSRRIDAARVENGRVTEAVQVIRPTKTGKVPAREVRAAEDIEKATGVKPRLVPVKPEKE